MDYFTIDVTNNKPSPVGQEEKTLLERLEGRWVRKDGQEMGEVIGSQGMLRWSKARAARGARALGKAVAAENPWETCVFLGENLGNIWENLGKIWDNGC